jgi:hypothetical protein
VITRDFPEGGYRYVPGVFQYSAGVRALPGHEIVRVRFRGLVPLPDGFQRIEALLRSLDRPLTAFCACELRSPAPFSEEGFRRFNRAYVEVLERWGLYRDGSNPVARSNVCPEHSPPPEPSFYAFAYTRPTRETAASFIVAGSGEVPEGLTSYGDHIIRRGDTSPEGVREKARYVLGEMERRLAALGASWQETTATQVYTVHDIYPFLSDEIVRRGAAQAGLTWHYNRPPVTELEYEMDCRGIRIEEVISV